MKGKRIGTAILALVLSIAVFFGLTFFMEKRYTATMGLLVDNNIRAFEAGNNFGPIDDIINFARARTVQTQLDIITGSAVLGAAIEKAAEKFPEEFKEEDKAAKIQKLVNRLRVDVSKDSDVITLRVTSNDPALSAEVANQIGFAFIDYSKIVATESGTAALQALNKQIETTTTKLESVDGEIAKIKIEHNASDLQATAAADAQNASALLLRLSSTQSDLNGRTAELAEAQQVLAGTPKEITTGTGRQLNPQYSQIEADLGRERAALEAARAQYFDDHVIVKGHLEQVRSLEAQLKAAPKEIQARKDTGPNPNWTAQRQAVDTLRGQVENLKQQRSQVSADYEKTSTRIQSFAGLEKQLAKLQRDRLVYDQNYAQLVQRRDVVEATGVGRSTRSKIVSPALALRQPSFPDTRLFIFMGIGLGVVFAALILMPKAPTDVFSTVIGERTGLGSGKKPQSLKPSDSDASALGTGDSGPPSA